MDVRRHLSDECRDILTRAGVLAEERGGQITSADFLAAMAEQTGSKAGTIIADAAAAKSVDPVELTDEILAQYEETQGA